MRSTGPDEVLEALIDPGSFRRWGVIAAHGGGRSADAGKESAAIAGASQPQGADSPVDSVVIGEASVAGTRIALILSDFAVAAGSIGREPADRIVAALRTATDLKLPVVASPASGGTRVQEGTPAFVRMIDIAAACRDHRRAGNALLVWLRHPTTGGVMATWGSLGQVTFGQPGALAGFLGPRLFEPLTGAPIAEDVQTTDNLARVGVIDAVVGLENLRGAVATLLDVVVDRPAQSVPARTSGTEPAVAAPAGTPRGESSTGDAPAPATSEPGSRASSPWDAVLATRNPERPGLRELTRTFDSVTPLHGTGTGERCDAVRVYLARLGSRRCVVIGQDRAAQSSGTPIGPAGLRTAQRGMALADELRLPLISVVDTAGGELSQAAEEGAIAGEIARCLARQVGVATPVVSLVLGMGCGGAALAMLPADRVLAAELAWVAPLPVEGASLIRYRDTEHVVELAAIMRIDSVAMLADGVVDEIISERSDGVGVPSDFIQRCSSALQRHLAELADLDADTRLALRARRYGAALRCEPTVAADGEPRGTSDWGTS